MFQEGVPGVDTWGGGWHEGTRYSSLEQCGLWGIVSDSACQKLGHKRE